MMTEDEKVAIEAVGRLCRGVFREFMSQALGGKPSDHPEAVEAMAVIMANPEGAAAWGDTVEKLRAKRPGGIIGELFSGRHSGGPVVGQGRLLGERAPEFGAKRNETK